MNSSHQLKLIDNELSKNNFFEHRRCFAFIGFISKLLIVERNSRLDCIPYDFVKLMRKPMKAKDLHVKYNYFYLSSVSLSSS